MQHDSMRVSEHALSIRRIPALGRKSILSVICEDSTTDSGNTFAENKNDKRKKKSLSHTDLEYQPLCCFIRLV